MLPRAAAHVFLSVHAKARQAEKYENVELSGQRDSAKTAKFSLLAA